MKRIALSLFFTVVALAAFADSAPKLTNLEKITLPYRAGEKIPLGDDGWKIFIGDEKNFADPGFDDSKWKTGKTNLSLLSQGFRPKPWALYRKQFELPAGWERCNLMLDLGFISAYDEVYLNGIRIGGYGTQPKLTKGASWVWRRYPLTGTARKALKPGKNLLAVRIVPGYASGMYNGTPAIYKLEELIYPRYRMKNPASLVWNLSDAEHLNRFRPGTPLTLALELTTIGDSTVPGMLSVRWDDDTGRELGRAERRGTLTPGIWQKFEPVTLTAPGKEGKFSVTLEFHDASGRVVWKSTLKAAVVPPVRFSLPVDRSLGTGELPLPISASSNGHFGPRHGINGKLADNFSIPDAHGTLAYSVRPAPECPLIFQTNVRPMPRNAPKPGELLAAKGKEYDGLLDAWIFGRITVPRSGRLKELSASGDWGSRTYRYKYENLKRFDFTISTVQPAWRLETDGRTVRLFDGVENYGAGLPTRLYGEIDGRTVGVDPVSGWTGKRMSANWLLASFAGSAGYDGFDVPWLIVLQHRPLTVRNRDGALELEFAGESGTIQAMPLYGVTLQNPEVTSAWKKGLPENVVARCRMWSKILAAAPEGPIRTADVNFNKDRLRYHDRFTHRTVHDDWNTPGRKIAPLSPILPPVLAAATGFKGAIDSPAEDLEYATLHGPLFAVPGDSVTVGIDGLLHFVNEVRVVTQRKTPQFNELRNLLNKRLLGGLKSLAEHPWKENFWRSKYVPGSMEPEFSNVLLALPYAADNVAAKIRASYRDEVENYALFDGKAKPEFAEKMRKDLRGSPVAVTLTAPSGLRLTTFAPNDTDYAIDSCCFEALRCYLLWDYARNCNGFDFIKANWNRILESYNFIPNAHSWPVGISYDTYGGIRVGNGLQETGIMHAGMCAVARMAETIGDRNLRDRAGYYAVMQLLGLQGAMGMNEFLRDWRPTLPESHRNSDVEFCEYNRKIHYVEFNENGGFTANVMLASELLNSHNSYIMTPLPEIMRPYLELFPTQTEDFFSLDYRNLPNNRSIAEPLSPDMRLYMIREYPMSVTELGNKRRGFPLQWRDQVNDIRAMLDSLGTVQYKKLW